MLNPNENWKTSRLSPSPTGRSLSEDPVGLIAGDDLNFYNYAHGIPVSLVDPYGTQSSPPDPCQANPGLCGPVGPPLYGDPNPGSSPLPSPRPPSAPPGWWRPGPFGSTTPDPSSAPKPVPPGSAADR